MAYKIVAERDSETVRSERDSLLIAIAKARIWADEGWRVVVTDEHGVTLDPAVHAGFSIPSFDRDANDARPHHAESAGGAEGDVDDSPPDEGATVIDAAAD